MIIMRMLIIAMLITTLSHAQQVTKDTIYLEWRGDKFFEVTETTLDNGQRSLNEKPVGDSLQALELYMTTVDKSFAELSHAARVLISKNAIIQNINRINNMMNNNLNSDIVSLSNAVLKDVIKGDYKIKLPDTELVDVTIENLLLKYEDKEINIMPVGSNFIQFTYEDKVYELYRLGEGQYASIDTSVILIKNDKS